MSTATRATMRSTDSPWGLNVKLPPIQKLDKDINTDVCIVGAGIAGLSVAYFLAKAGKEVVVVDDGRIGGGQTSMTTAHLSNAIDCRYIELDRIHGEERARLAADSHTQAIRAIEQIVAEENLSCEFKRLDGYLFQPADDDSDLLDREWEAATRTNVVRVERLARAPFPDFHTGPCLRFADQGEFHPMKYLAGLARAIHARGGVIYSPTHAERIDGGKLARVKTEHGSIVADAVVVATNTPVNDIVTIHTKQVAYLTYVIAGRVPVDSIPHALFWDTQDPYHYVRLRKLVHRSGEDSDLLIVGGEDHRTGQANDGAERFSHLERWARERFPTLRDIEYHWAGQVMETIDGLGYIGRNPGDADNVYIATGDCGQGMTHGTIAGMLITDLILGRENPWADVYDPARVRAKALGEYVREGSQMVSQYAAWLTPGEVGSIDEVPPGEGAILRRGLQKIAVHRKNDGEVIQCSAVCPHLDCVVAWNSTEQTWDCPCHGSRFSPEGKVLNGPANSDLKKVDD